MFRLSCLVAVVSARPVQIGGPKTILEAISKSQLAFNLGNIDVVEENGGESVSLQVPGWMKTNEPGEPEVPVLRASMLLPRGATGDVKVVVNDAVTSSFPLSAWGKRIQHSQGKLPMCGPPNATVPPSDAAYSKPYPTTPAVNVHPVHTWRDVQGVVVEVQPVKVDHARGVVEVLHNCSIQLEWSAPAEEAAPLKVDPAFYDAYAFVYSNWLHQKEDYEAADENGRVLVIYESQYESQAQTYADLVKSRGFPNVLMQDGSGAASDIQSVISKHYHEPEQLSYITIIGRNVASKYGPQTYHYCDNCYAMMSGGTNIDIFIGRISGGSSSDIETYLNKIKKYDSSSTAPWTKKAYGTAAQVNYDEYQCMTDLMNDLKQDGFTTDWAHADSTSGQTTLSKMNQGLGVFAYIGHGSGTAWNTPSISEYDIAGLTNVDQPFFDLDVSCNNGGFGGKKCMGEALITSEGGSIGTMMSAPEARGTMCKKMQQQAALALGQGVGRIGQVYATGLNKANQLDRDDYMVQAYNVFADPTLWLAFAKGSPSEMVVV